MYVYFRSVQRRIFLFFFREMRKPTRFLLNAHCTLSFYRALCSSGSPPAGCSGWLTSTRSEDGCPSPRRSSDLEARVGAGSRRGMFRLCPVARAASQILDRPRRISLKAEKEKERRERERERVGGIGRTGPRKSKRVKKGREKKKGRRET